MDQLIASAVQELLDEERDRTRQERGSAGGRPPRFNPVDYRDCNVAEGSFNNLKQWRGLATRYDKIAIVALAVLNAATRWFRPLRVTP